jgi:hypothetical protein
MFWFSAIAKAFAEFPLLSYFALSQAVLGLVTFGLSTVDKQTITGANRWIKPTKFFGSVAIYCATLPFLLGPLQANHGWAVTAISLGVVVMMIIENGLITMQAIRGVHSHFNTNSGGFNAAVFGIMGLAIAVNTALIVWLLALYFTPVNLPSAVIWGVRLGIAVFVFGGFVGGRMGAQLRHSVGGEDGGQGLKWLGWSTRHGDLRIAHFMGIHGLQAIPLAGFLFEQWLNSSLSLALTLVFSSAYTFICVAVYRRAIKGLPLRSNPNSNSQTLELAHSGTNSSH